MVRNAFSLSCVKLRNVPSMVIWSVISSVDISSVAESQEKRVFILYAIRSVTSSNALTRIQMCFGRSSVTRFPIWLHDNTGASFLSANAIRR